MSLESRTSSLPVSESSRLLASVENSNLLEKTDTLSDKLFREAAVLLGGATIGAAQTAAKRIEEQPLETLGQTGISAALGYGFVRLASSSLAPIRYGLPVISGALTYSFAANILTDIKNQATTVSNAWTNTWNDPNSTERERAAVAKSLGPFAFDMTLNTVAGLVGGKVAANGVENRAILKLMDDKYGEQIRASVFKLASEPDKTNLRYIGSSFATDEKTLATAFHVVQDKPSDKWLYFNAKEKGNARVIAGLPDSDLALLKSDGASPFKQSLPLAKSIEGPQAGVLVGSPGAKDIVMKPGVFEPGIGPLVNSYRADLGEEITAGFTRALRGGKSWVGMSGGPVVSEAGEAIGVMSTLNPVLNVVGLGTSSSPSSNLRYLMNLVERGSQPGASMSLAEASQSLSINPAMVLARIKSGKLEGYVVPSKSIPLDWEWRILK